MLRHKIYHILYITYDIKPYSITKISAQKLFSIQSIEARIRVGISRISVVLNFQVCFINSQLDSFWQRAIVEYAEDGRILAIIRFCYFEYRRISSSFDCKTASFGFSYSKIWFYLASIVFSCIVARRGKLNVWLVLRLILCQLTKCNVGQSETHLVQNAQFFKNSRVGYLSFALIVSSKRSSFVKTVKMIFLSCT